MEQKRRECEVHGAFTSRKVGPIWSPCPKCMAERQRAEAEAAHRRVVEANRYASGIPLRFVRCGFENYEASNQGQRYALDTARSYAERFREDARKSGACLSFLGTVGTGKTHLACAIGNAVLDAGLKVLYTTARKAVNTLKETWRRDADTTEAQALTTFLTPDLLILDEVGVQFGTEAERVLLFDVLNGRYERMLPGVIVSNLGLEGLQQSIGARCVDRLREGGALVDFKWQSYRR